MQAAILSREISGIYMAKKWSFICF